MQNYIHHWSFKLKRNKDENYKDLLISAREILEEIFLKRNTTLDSVKDPISGKCTLFGNDFQEIASKSRVTPFIAPMRRQELLAPVNFFIPYF